MSIRRATATLREQVRLEREAPEAAVGLPSGVPPLDRKLRGGFPKGVMVTVGARTGIGKSVVLAEFLRNGAEWLLANEDSRVIPFISAEMPGADVLRRLVCAELLLPNYGLKDLEGARLSQYQAVLERMESWPVDIHDGRGMDVADVSEHLDKVAGGWDPGDGPSPFAAIFVDHLGKLRAGSASAGYDTVSKVADWLYGLAGYYDCPVVVAAQMNRDVEKEITTNKDGTVNVERTRPMLHHIEGSGKIEQNSDIFIIPWRRERYLAQIESREEARGVMEWNVAKNRHGSTGLVNVDFTPEFTRLDYPGRKPLLESGDWLGSRPVEEIKRALESARVSGLEAVA